MDRARRVIADSAALSRVLVVAGIVGVAASLVVGIVGWMVAGRAIDAVAETVGPIAGIAEDMAETVEATAVLLDRTTEAIESIEAATRSTVQALDSVTVILDDTAALAAGDIADSLDAAVDTLPALVSTAGVIDNTMRALSFVGVDYDPAEPLDDSLAALEASLEPIPGQIRDQVELFGDVQTDLDQIVADGQELSGVLLEARLELVEAEAALTSAAGHATAAAGSLAAINNDIETYGTVGRIGVVAAAVAIFAASLAPLLMGLHLRNNEVE